MTSAEAAWARRTRRAAALLTLALALLLALNLPFYAGSNVGARHAWRMEHGRLTLQSRERVRQDGFWLAGNTEGLRFAHEWHRWPTGEWELVVPLWMPLAAAVVLWLALRARARRLSGGGTPSRDR